MKFSSQKYGDQSGQILHNSLFPPAHSNSLLHLHRDSHLAPQYPELKDPSIVSDGKGGYFLYASIGSSITQQWIVGRFAATAPDQIWTELSPVTFEKIAGPQLCAPALLHKKVDQKSIWQMYIQTSCFEENGVIALANSEDGQHFVGQPEPVIRHQEITDSKQPVVGVYDAGISELKIENKPFYCLIFSGYRRVGCGDVYMSLCPTDQPGNWSKPEELLAQEEVPFHNQPTDHHFEWGLEGAQIIQLDKQCFLMIGVCFLPLPDGHLGKRQRVFFATSQNVHGPYIPLGVPFEPQKYETQAGEHGHPDSLVLGDDFWLIFQERSGDKKPWHLRIAQFKVSELKKYAQQILWVAQHLPNTRLTPIQSHDQLETKVLSDASRCVWVNPQLEQGNFLDQLI
jgi:hypothetical protein